MVVDPVFPPNVLQNWLAFRIDDRTIFAKQNPNSIEQVIINMIHN